MRVPITVDDILYLSFELECNFAYIMDIDVWLQIKKRIDR